MFRGRGGVSRFLPNLSIYEPSIAPPPLQAASKELKQVMKHKDLKSENIESMQDNMQDLLVSREG